MAPFDDPPGRASSRPGSFRSSRGPALVWIVLALGSGEVAHWSYLVAKYGLTFLWLLVPAGLVQYPLNVAVGRHTLVTGESVLGSLARVHVVVAFVVWLLLALACLWIGTFVSAGGAALAGLTQFPGAFTPRGRALVWSYAVVVAGVGVLLRADDPYRVVERFATAVALLTGIALLWAATHGEVRAALPSFVTALAGPPGPSERAWDVTDSRALLTAVTCVGLGGFWVLLSSQWVRARSPHGSPAPSASGLDWSVSPPAGSRREDEPRGGEDLGEPVADRAREAPDERTLLWPRARRWLGVEVLIAIGGNLAATLFTCLLAYALVYPHGVVPEGGDLSVVERVLLDVAWGPVGRVVLLVVSAAIASCAWLVAADGLSRFHAEIAASVVPAVRRLGPHAAYAGALAIVAGISCVALSLGASGSVFRLSTLAGIAGGVLFPPVLYVCAYGRAVPSWGRPRAFEVLALASAFVVSVLLAAAYGWAAWPWW